MRRSKAARRGSACPVTGSTAGPGFAPLSCARTAAGTAVPQPRTNVKTRPRVNRIRILSPSGRLANRQRAPPDSGVSAAGLDGPRRRPACQGPGDPPTASSALRRSSNSLTGIRCLAPASLSCMRVATCDQRRIVFTAPSMLFGTDQSLIARRCTVQGRRPCRWLRNCGDLSRRPPTSTGRRRSRRAFPATSFAFTWRPQSHALSRRHSSSATLLRRAANER